MSISKPPEAIEWVAPTRPTCGGAVLRQVQPYDCETPKSTAPRPLSGDAIGAIVRTGTPPRSGDAIGAIVRTGTPPRSGSSIRAIGRTGNSTPAVAKPGAQRALCLTPTYAEFKLRAHDSGRP